MPGEHIRETCCSCAGFLDRPPLDRCEEPGRHDPPKPGKGLHPPYVAEAVVDLARDDEEEDEQQGPRSSGEPRPPA